MTQKPDGLRPGLYEALVTQSLEERLSTVEPDLVRSPPLHQAEAANRIALHLSRQVERALAAVDDKDRVATGVAVVKAVIGQLEELIQKAGVGPEVLAEPGSVLRAISARQPDGRPRDVESPLIPLLDTTLLTNSPGEPSVGHQLRAEIGSANSIDVLMAFVRTTGIAPLVEALGRHVSDGGRVRVITTTYTGSTERKALDRLRDLGAQVRVSYDTSTTRLHAKAWLFNRSSGFSTAYVGSSNLTHSAQITGLEWNVRASGARNPDVIDKVRAVFESYWENPDFRDYDPAEFDQLSSLTRDSGPTVYLSPVEIAPLPFQSRMLDLLALERSLGRHRNLLVSATGTGKTVMAALDYARLRGELPRARLLFVAHRQEILDQSQAMFRHALRQATFGEQWIGGHRPTNFEHVFASVQTLNKLDLRNLDPKYFDVVIIDEFHHSAAPSYERLLEHLEPRELLGLTATPERADGLPVLKWFGNRVAADLRVWDAIDQQYLSPFAYFGVHDGLDLTKVPWVRGRGYDVDGLTNLYTANDVAARRVVQELRDRVGDLGATRGLGFCVSVAHAHFMSRVFNECGVPAAAVDGSTPPEERRLALSRLESGEVNVVFSVDIFNEGVDLPNVDVLLLLRPTESATVFLQQLGRGLRRRPGKICTVLDFVGLHRREFRFDLKFRALLGGTRKDILEQVETRFPYLPAGCHMELDPVASRVVLDSLKSAIPSNWPQKVAELRALVDSGREATLQGFLAHSGLELADLYAGGRSWSDLRVDAGVPVLQIGPVETELRRAFGRLLHVDDRSRIEFWRGLLTGPVPVVASMDGRDVRLTRMLLAQLVGQVPTALLPRDADVQAALELVRQHPQATAELDELLAEVGGRIDHLPLRLDSRPHVPLQIHARYTRLEILAAMGAGTNPRVESWQSGVRWLPGENADAFAFTLDKETGSFSPTTRYRDYAISRQLIHWESQSNTRADSDTGQRYQRHIEMGSEVFLFARLRQTDRAFWFLGPARYVSHEGECPMAITWKLDVPLPGDLYLQFAAAVA